MKKDEFRFTLRFCSDAPKQITATNVLNAAGKRKASLIADLIDEQIKRCGENAFADYFLYSALKQDTALGASISQIVSNTDDMPLQTLKMSVDTTNHIEPNDDTTQLVISSDDETFDAEMHNAVMNGLNMFKKA